MDMLAAFSANLSIGLNTALSPGNLLYCFIGVLVGTLVGVLPGIGTIATIAMLLPLTFHLDVVAAMIMLAGIWYGSSYGGSTAAILLRLPGSTSSAVTSLDGFPMMKKGRAGVALLMAAVASFVGGSIGILIMMLFSPAIVAYAVQFSSPEYFSIMLLGLLIAATAAGGSVSKSIAMVAAGVMLSLVGMDMYTGEFRFTFNSYELAEGISLTALAIGIFGIPEIISSIREMQGGRVDPQAVTFRSMIPTREELRRSTAPILRGSGIGALVGALPGAGSTIASFLAYATENRVSKEPERFGQGAIEGVVAPEAANNAADQTAFIPTLTLGIPGSATMAIMVGALLIQGIAPGPNLVNTRPDLFWGLVMSFWFGNIMLLVLNIPLIGLWIRLLLVPYRVLYPAILMFACIGVYAVASSPFEVWTIVVFGAIGYLMRLAQLPPAAMLLGFVLGPMLEENFRRALLLSNGDFSTFFVRPISGSLMGFIGVLIVWRLWRYIASRRSDRTIVEAGS